MKRILLLSLGLIGLTAIARGQAVPQVSTMSLHAAIQRAETSPQVREAQDFVDAAHGSVTQAGLHPNPRLYLQSEDLRPWADNFDFPNATEDYGYLGQVFELGGKRSRRLDVARANVRQAEAERTFANQQIAGRVAAAYWNAVASAGVAALLENDMKAVDEIVRYNQERVNAGAMRGIDLLRVQIERDRLQLALGAAQRDVTLTRIELFRQIGQPNDPGVHLGDSIDSVVPVEAVPVDEVLASRADIVAGHEAVAAAEADVKLQKSLGVPDIDLLGGYKRNSGNNTIYSSLQLPLPIRNRNQGEVERAEASVHLAQDRLQQLELSVRADVMAAEENYTQQRRVVETVLPDIRSRARQNLAIMDDAYRSGGVDLLRYLDAERTAFDVEVNALRTFADFQQAGLRLQLAYGVRP